MNPCLHRPKLPGEIVKAGLSGMAMCVAGLPFRALAFPPEQPDEELVSFLDMPRAGEQRLDWETLSDWLTPQDQAFNVQHYDIPEFEAKDFKLEVTGLVAKPITLTMNDLRSASQEGSTHDVGMLWQWLLQRFHERRL